MYTTHSLKTRIILTRAISKLATTTGSDVKGSVVTETFDQDSNTGHLTVCSHTYYQLQVQILGPEMLGKHQHYCIGHSWL